MEYIFIERAGPGEREQIVSLYRMAGWWTQADEQDPGLLDKLIRGSHCFIICLSDREIVGMGRAISDMAYDAYIQDIFVKPEFRRKGIAACITSIVLKRIRTDGIKWIGLISTPEAKGIYSRLGFREKDGIGMLLETDGKAQC